MWILHPNLIACHHKSIKKFWFLMALHFAFCIPVIFHGTLNVKCHLSKQVLIDSTWESLTGGHKCIFQLPFEFSEIDGSMFLCLSAFLLLKSFSQQYTHTIGMYISFHSLPHYRACTQLDENALILTVTYKRFPRQPLFAFSKISNMRYVWLNLRFAKGPFRPSHQQLHAGFLL